MTGRSGEDLTDYLEALEASGAEPVLLLVGDDPPSISALDALLLTGGPDVDPVHYGEETLPGHEVVVDPQRDALELPLVHEAVERDLPVLGICRGAQVVNVSLGGTLYQDVDLQRKGRQEWSHQQRRSHPEAPQDAAMHEVVVRPHSLLRAATATDRLGVNTFHHQAIRDLASLLIPTGWAVRDGAPDLVEAVEAPSRRFLVGVQWHPERMWKRHPACHRLFQALVEAASRRTGG